MTWNLDDIAGPGAAAPAAARPLIGIDLGSRASKGALLLGRTVHTAVIPTGLFMQETADELVGKLLAAAGVARADVAGVVATGYGRIALRFDDLPFEVVTEISCHAMGAHTVCPATRTIVDIGGQDSKAIQVDPATGKVLDFVMNDKCAAGTGRFLEKAAMLLGLDLDRLGEVALKATDPAQVSSQCVVFAESEMISLRARGDRQGDGAASANIAAGVHYSAARRVRNLLGRVGLEPALVFTGGVSNNPGMRHALEALVGSPFADVRFDLMYAGALGAAVFAADVARARTPSGAPATAAPDAAPSPVEAVKALVAEAQASFAAKEDGEKRVGTLCAYTPLELLDASGVRNARLFRAGDPETVARGELYAQSVFCDFSKSCLGEVAGGPLEGVLDKVYSFHTCASMKRVGEVMGRFVPTELLNLPKLRDQAGSRRLFREEIVAMRDDLEALTGRVVDEARVAPQLALHNRVRRLLRALSELRKRPHPPLTGGEYLELVRAYYHLPKDRLVGIYEGALEALAARAAPQVAPPPLRLMISGSIMGEGDRRILDLVEGELGARVVVEDHCAGVRPFLHEVREDGDPWEALAAGYLDQAPCARMKPLHESVELGGRLATEYRADAVLFVYLKFCACYGVSKGAFLDHYAGLGLPVLDLSSDYSQSDHGQIKTRLEAFLEVLAARAAAPACSNPCASKEPCHAPA
jgi:predicted CoA-substrate-specific enzyme activase